jgi:hypothetical protein
VSHVLLDLRVEFWKRCLVDVTAPQSLGLFKIGVDDFTSFCFFDGSSEARARIQIVRHSPKFVDRRHASFLSNGQSSVLSRIKLSKFRNPTHARLLRIAA